MPAPTADRPRMPGYGLLDAGEGRGLLPWAWAEERLTQARNYWVSTAGEDGRPHAMPVWAVWLDGAAYFSTGRQTRKARNLAHRPECVLSPESGAEAVVVEGAAEEIVDRETLERVAGVYTDKYGMGFPPEEPVYRVRPLVAFGLIEGAEEFAGAATRWRFPDTRSPDT
ncbi:MAG TPA: pyridoxamine 5'-phosphate oxidase family protein [Acidimicrobiia bacterium]|nr:pyridoxamine 5'-phosphate oxidase family protein [Acidimicrobiia bacterium]